MATRTLAVVLGLAATTTMAAAADDGTTQTLLDRAAIQELVTRYVTGLDTLDADLYAGVFAEDAVFELPGGVVHRGRAAIAKILTDLQASRARNEPTGGQFIVGFMGRYDDALVKRDGRWYIQSRKLVSFVE